MALAMINEKTTLPPTVKDNKAHLNSTSESHAKAEPSGEEEKEKTVIQGANDLNQENLEVMQSML